MNHSSKIRALCLELGNLCFVIIILKCNDDEEKFIIEYYSSDLQKLPKTLYIANQFRVSSSDTRN